MKAIFGFLSILLALAIVASLAKKQMHALGAGSVTTRSVQAASEAAAMAADPGSRDGATIGIPGGMPGAMAADPNMLTVPQQSQNIQQKMRDDTVRAMQQGMQRNERASP